uniref:Uncharacterized protein n=1 Tax=Chromera velia CCMP2878 TaxID=1169474 RepID=A0A0K6S9Q7_9ALVE|eukprot:Cvel_30066.t1-p1 / transcript=Cvel_30066.t1 / gene=Cvel_30066 / organism=Chromera_velia_CCMP2878 / gene_product=hypothetical protein / transcript_product=hypothetical protein / location=Cvel_scaffold4229:7202-8060(-) / protein_length=258 / sequence_SO=supercontig / SO=protein_coding / is_pseudo=false
MPSTAISRLLKSYTASRLAEMQAQDGEVDTGDKEECQGACTEAEEVTTVAITLRRELSRTAVLGKRMGWRDTVEAVPTTQPQLPRPLSAYLHAPLHEMKRKGCFSREDDSAGKRFAFEKARRQPVLPSPLPVRMPEREKTKPTSTWAQSASVKVGSQSKVSFVVGNGHKTTGILDSGAEVSFIDVLLTLYADSPVVPATLALSAAGGSGLKVLGETTISLSHPNNPEKKFLHTLLVTADTGYDLVLGQDFLKLKDPVV